MIDWMVEFLMRVNVGLSMLLTTLVLIITCLGLINLIRDKLGLRRKRDLPPYVQATRRPHETE